VDTLCGGRRVRGWRKWSRRKFRQPLAERRRESGFYELLRPVNTMAAVASLNKGKEEVGKAAAATHIESEGSDPGTGGAISMFFPLDGLRVAEIDVRQAFNIFIPSSSLGFVGWRRRYVDVDGAEGAVTEEGDDGGAA